MVQRESSRRRSHDRRSRRIPVEDVPLDDQSGSTLGRNLDLDRVHAGGLDIAIMGSGPRKDVVDHDPTHLLAVEDNGDFLPFAEICGLAIGCLLASADRLS